MNKLDIAFYVMIFSWALLALVVFFDFLGILS